MTAQETTIDPMGGEADALLLKMSMHKIGLAMPVLAQVDTTGIIRTIEMAHSIGPFLDPTKYRDALYRGDMDAIADLARALEPALAIWRERIEPKMTER